MYVEVGGDVLVVVVDDELQLVVVGVVEFDGDVVGFVIGEFVFEGIGYDFVDDEFVWDCGVDVQLYVGDFQFEGDVVCGGVECVEEIVSEVVQVFVESDVVEIVGLIEFFVDQCY